MRACKFHPHEADARTMPDGTNLCSNCYGDRGAIDESGDNFGLSCDDFGDFPLFSELPPLIQEPPHD